MDPFAAEAWEMIRRRKDVPARAKWMVLQHLRKPWVDGFRITVISPLKDGLDGYLGAEILDDGKRPWFFPSLRWWRSHWTRSHGPDGGGCDVGIHTRFLAHDAEDPEFLYADVAWNGTMSVLGRRDFEAECRAWRRLGA